MPDITRSDDGSTRSRMLELLCGENHTTSELAEALGITPNGARGHLDRLETEGLVEHGVVRRGVGKPAHEYRLTAAGSLRTSRAYLPLLSALLTAASAAERDLGTEALLRDAGRILVRERPRPEGTLRERVEWAVRLLGELGGRGVVREEGDLLWIDGACCPLRAIVDCHPLACTAIEAMLGDFISAPVHEYCRRSSTPACRFAIGAGHPVPSGA